MELIKEISKCDKLEIGNKANNLKRLIIPGINIPKSWVLSADVLIEILKNNGFKVEEKGIPISSPKYVNTIKEYFKNNFLNDYYFQLFDEIEKIKETAKIKNIAVRSSGNVEDSSKSSLSGVFESYLNIGKTANVIFYIRDCIINSINSDIVEYMNEKDFSYIKPCSIIIQEFINSYKSGVIFKDKEKKIINMNFGMNKYIVDGNGNIDEIVLDFKNNVKEYTKNKKYACFPVFSKTNPRVNDKIPIRALEEECKIIESDINNRYVTIEMNNTQKDILKEDELKYLLSTCTKVSEILDCENYDIEWTFDKDKLYILQCRPLTTDKILINTKEKNSQRLGLVSGEYVCKLRKVTNLNEAKDVKKGETLVAKSLNKSALMVLSKAGACIISAKSPLSHSSILARERGIPTIGAVEIDEIIDKKTYKINGKTGEYSLVEDEKE